MAEWSKAPDSRFNPCFLIGSEHEISGPLMRAGVRIPFLTKTIFINLSSLYNYVNVGVIFELVCMTGDIAQW